MQISQRKNFPAQQFRPSFFEREQAKVTLLDSSQKYIIFPKKSSQPAYIKNVPVLQCRCHDFSKKKLPYQQRSLYGTAKQSISISLLWKSTDFIRSRQSGKNIRRCAVGMTV